MSKTKLVRAAGQIMFIMIISKMLGFLRDTLTASVFGATDVSDAYMMSLTIPNMIFGLAGVALTATFIPILSDILKEKGKESMFKFANSVMSIVTIGSIIFCVIGWIFSPQLVKMIAPKFTGEKYLLTVYLTKLSIINILFLSLNSGCMAILQTMDDFLGPALTGIALDIPIIIYLLFTKNHTITELTIITLIGSASQIIIQTPWLIKNGYRLSVGINLKDDKIKKMFHLIIPVILGIDINQINAFIDRLMASGLENGSISALQYSSRLNTIVYSIFASAIVTVMYPTLSKSISEENLDYFKYYMKKSINSINLIMIPSTVGIIILRETIISILFERGAFDRRAVQMTSSVLLYLSPGICILGIRDIYNRAFYTLKNTKIPMKNGAIGIIVNIIMNYIFVKRMGIRGLALGTSISIIICTVLLIIDLNKQIGKIDSNAILSTLYKIVLSSAIMGFLVFYLNKIITINIKGSRGNLTSFILSTLIGSIIYVILINLFKIEEYKEIKEQLMVRLKKRKKKVI